MSIFEIVVIWVAMLVCALWIGHLDAKKERKKWARRYEQRKKLHEKYRKSY